MEKGRSWGREEAGRPAGEAGGEAVPCLGKMLVADSAHSRPQGHPGARAEDTWAHSLPHGSKVGCLL